MATIVKRWWVELRETPRVANTKANENVYSPIVTMSI